MFPGLNDADCLAAGMRHGDLRSAAGRFRSTGGCGADRPARSRGFGAARRGVGTLVARRGMRLRGAHGTAGPAAGPPSALRPAR